MNTAIKRPEMQAMTYPSRRLIHAEMLKFVKPETWRGVTVFAVDFGIWMAAVAGVLFLHPL
jgi:hypothetical protein